MPHTIIADNAGGHYMQHGKVDLCITGTDRVTANGDVANKIGTYLKALAAKDNDVPFYVALPSSTIDWSLHSGRDIPIEERSADELLKMTGRLPDGDLATVEIAAPGCPGANPAFDVTPARLVTGFITERGVCAATEEGLRGCFRVELSSPANSRIEAWGRDQVQRRLRDAWDECATSRESLSSPGEQPHRRCGMLRSRGPEEVPLARSARENAMEMYRRDRRCVESWVPRPRRDPPLRARSSPGMTK